MVNNTLQLYYCLEDCKMKKTFIKALSVVMVVVMTFTASPLSGFVGLELPEWLDFSVEAEAAEPGVSGYSAGAAVQWALDHYNDVDSVLTGQGYWSNGGDCANFVSQCVYMGGIDMQQYTWYSNGMWRIWGDFTWIRAHELYQYMVSLGGISINNPQASNLSIGDLIFYVTRADGEMHHSAIVVDIENGVPVICAHSVFDDSTGQYIKYKTSDWTLGYSGSRIYAVKMYGDLCSAENPRDIDVYTAKDGDRKNLYASPSTASANVGSVMAGAATYIHVYETRNVNGELWGKTQWAGIWAWTKLSGFNKKADVKSYVPTHDFGATETIITPTCITDGSEKRVCKRCGYTETNVLPKSGHAPGAEATCTTPQICTLCNVILTDALGHNFEGEMKLPTCTEAASGNYICTRCHYEHVVSEAWTEFTIPVQEYNGHYYQIFNESMTWEKANEFCNSLRGHLVVINNEDEQNFLTELAADIGKDFLWIGLYSEDGSTWKWINNDEINYTNWADGEQSGNSTELYAHLSDNRWYSVSNAGNEGVSDYGIICEWDSYEEYPDFWKGENTAAVKTESGYMYQKKETTTSYETSLDGYIQDGGTWVQQASGTVEYVSPWQPGFERSHPLYTQYNNTPKTASETETTKTTVSTSVKGYIYWHWCRGEPGHLYTSRSVSDEYTPEYDTFHAFFSTYAAPIGDAQAPHNDGFTYTNESVCTDSYWWISPNNDYVRVYVDTWTNYNKLFNYYKWVDLPGYAIKENLPAELITALDNNENTSENYNITDTKTLYSYRLDALGHEMGEWYAGEVATCLKNGYNRRDCKFCDYFETEETTAECVVVIDEAIEATCISTGLTEGSHCGVCGKIIVAQKVVEKKDHTFGDWTEVYGISCGKGGLEERICSYCGYTEQRAIENPNPDHLGPVTTEIHEAGCEHLFAQGWTDYRCECCGEEWTDDFTDPLSAQWSDWTITKSPDCSQNPNIDPVENGQRQRECLLCGLSETESILANHNLANYDISSSCTQGGTRGQKCTVCGQIWAESTDELGHDLYDDWYIVYKANCDNAGQEKRECHRDGCEYFETRVINATGHNYKLVKSVNPECTEQGYDYYECQNDSSHNYTDYNVAALGHKLGDVQVVQNADCLNDGEKIQKCERCDITLQSEIIPAYGHDWGEWKIITPAKCEHNGLEKRICKNNESHVEENILDAIGHDWDDGVIDPLSSCNAHGTKTYTCQNDSSHTYTEEISPDPDNHIGEKYVKDEKTPTCTEDGYTGDTYCSDCNTLLESGKVIPALGHDDSDGWVITDKADCLNNGEKEQKCKRCNTLIKTEIIPARKHNWSAWTLIDEPTIESTGKEEHRCQNTTSTDEYDSCNAFEQREIDKLKSYTAKFIVPDGNGDFVYNGKKYTVIKTVIFGEDETSIINPDVPERPGYVGSWKNYTLKNEDIIIEAEYTLKSSDNESVLEPDKHFVYKDGIATITLSAQAETLNAKVPLGATPYDIILVLDQSSSMRNYIDKQTRLQVLQSVAKDFIDTVDSSANENNVDHRIAIVGFSSGANNNYNGTGLFTLSGALKKCINLDDSDYASAYIDVKNNASALKNIISNMQISTGTSADLGLKIAENIVANNKDNNRKQLVIFITDGEPARPYENSIEIADEAIYNANQIKNKYNVPIYSIGVAAGANPANETNKINVFLHSVSSNYPDATSMENRGTAAPQKSYFLSAKDSDELKTIFKDITSQQIVNTISFTKVSFVDTISKYFTLTIENENALRESVKSEYGVSDDDISITKNYDGTTTIKIDNLIPKPIFNEVNIQTGYGVTVVFQVTANEKTLGGGDFTTNTEDSGIEHNGIKVVEFEVPDKETIEEGRAIVEFRIGNEVYAIREVQVGDTIVPPETNMADWIITDNNVVTENYTVIQTDYTPETRTISWYVGDETITQTYHIGEVITPVEVENLDGMLFIGWNEKVPYRMPETDLSFFAIFEAHEHAYELVSKHGNCVDGLTYVYSCVCGDTYNETKTYDKHSFTANILLINYESVATMICTECDITESKVLHYTAAYSSNGTDKNHFGFRPSTDKYTNVINLNMYDNNGVIVQPDGYIYVKVRIEDKALAHAKAGTLIVKRINENNVNDNIPFLQNPSEDTCGYYVDDEYLVLKLDHFSYYMYTTEEFISCVPSYEEIDCAFKGHSFIDGTCAVCGQEVLTLNAMTPQIRFDRNEDGSYAGTFDVRTRVMISDEDFAKFVGTNNKEAIENIDKVGFIYTVNGANFSSEAAQAVAQGETVPGYVDAPVQYIQDADGYYMFTCLVTDIPDQDKEYVLTAYAYICVNGDWYFSEVPMDADFNNLYSIYYPVACEKYGW